MSVPSETSKTRFSAWPSARMAKAVFKPGPNPSPETHFQNEIGWIYITFLCIFSLVLGIASMILFYKAEPGIDTSVYEVLNWVFFVIFAISGITIVWGAACSLRVSRRRRRTSPSR